MATMNDSLNEKKNEHPQFIAVDLGSNSFHLAHFEYRNNKMHSVKVLKDLVRMAGGIQNGSLNKDTKNKVLRCLHIFSEYLKENPDVKAQAVGTSSFRRLDKEPNFIEHAQNTLGLNIDILSGDDEAQLIYQGVILGREDKARVIFDIGGGSSEVAFGHDAKANHWLSLNQGSLRLSEMFFQGNSIDKKNLLEAEAFLQQQLNDQAHELKGLKFDEAWGASGSVKSVLWALQHLGLTKNTITLDALEKARPLIYQVSTLDQMSQLLNLNLRRTMLFPAGFVIIHQLMLFFGVQELDISYQAIREGLAAKHFQQVSSKD
jgi:exopolyphosphatase / guanosine-5'-triphosphate,3'-diphosphate pyrophosphatase